MSFLLAKAPLFISTLLKVRNREKKKWGEDESYPKNDRHVTQLQSFIIC